MSAMGVPLGVFVTNECPKGALKVSMAVTWPIATCIELDMYNAYVSTLPRSSNPSSRHQPGGPLLSSGAADTPIMGIESRSKADPTALLVLQPRSNHDFVLRLARAHGESPSLTTASVLIRRRLSAPILLDTQDY